MVLDGLPWVVSSRLHVLKRLGPCTSACPGGSTTDGLELQGQQCLAPAIAKVATYEPGAACM